MRAAPDRIAYAVRVMRRRLFKLGLFLMLGAIVNVAVAWGCILFSPRSPNDDGGRPGEWPVVESPGFICRTIYLRSEPGVTTLHAWGRSDESMGGSMLQFVVSAGWPLRSVRRVIHQYIAPLSLPGSPEFRTPCNWREGLEIPAELKWLDRQSRGALPVEPVWVGFAVDTLFQAAIMWCILAAPFALRRRSRTRRGLCLHCGYPIGSSDVCSECGKPVIVNALSLGPSSA